MHRQTLVLIKFLKTNLYTTLNGEANNFKMELFNDIHEGSGGC